MNQENPSLENILNNFREAAEINKSAAEIMKEVILRMAARMEKRKGSCKIIRFTPMIPKGSSGRNGICQRISLFTSNIINNDL